MNHARKRILISDSDVEVLIALEHALEDDGFDTTTASTMDETLRYLHQGEYDLILAADHPPEVDCEQLLRDLQSHTPIVAMENRPRHPFAEPYLLSLGAKRIVNKWQREEVENAVSEVLSVPAGEAGKRAVAATANLG